MGSPLSFFRMHCDLNHIGTPLPALPARRGEGGRRPGEGRFMELDQMRENGILSTVRAFEFRNLNCSGALSVSGGHRPPLQPKTLPFVWPLARPHIRLHELRMTNVASSIKHQASSAYE